MEERASIYYGDPSHGPRGVTKGHTLHPCIFNIMVDTILCHWVGLVVENKACLEGFGYMVA